MQIRGALIRNRLHKDTGESEAVGTGGLTKTRWVSGRALDKGQRHVWLLTLPAADTGQDQEIRASLQRTFPCAEKREGCVLLPLQGGPW